MTDNYGDLSELEREFELEMDGAQRGDFEMEFENAPEGSELEFEFESDDEVGDDMEMSFEEGDLAQEFEESVGDSRSQEFVDRLMEIGTRQFETPYEAEAALNEVMGDVEREYFFGALKRGLKKLAKNKLLRSLAQKGLTMGVNKFFPGLQGALQLARGNLRGALVNLGKQALGSVVPGGGAMLDAVKAIGIDPVGGVDQEREAWENYVDLSREAYEHLAENLTPRAHQPGEAVRLAHNAMQHAIRRAEARNAGFRRRPDFGYRQSPARKHGKVMHLQVSPGERVKLVIVGA